MNPARRQERRGAVTDAHAKAVEAAARALCDAQLGEGVWDSLWDNQQSKWIANAETQNNAYLAAMRAEGWVMVRDCGEATAPLGDTTKPTDVRLALEDAYEDGWNEARAAMLGGNDDER
jgi:hypothetical protein